MPSCVLGRGWLKPVQEGMGLWAWILRQSPLELLGGKGEGRRPEGCDRDSGRGASDLPSPLQPITAPGPRPSCDPALKPPPPS